MKSSQSRNASQGDIPHATNRRIAFIIRSFPIPKAYKKALWLTMKPKCFFSAYLFYIIRHTLLLDMPGCLCPGTSAYRADVPCRDYAGILACTGRIPQGQDRPQEG